MKMCGVGSVGFSIKSFVILTHYYAWIRVKCFNHLLHINHTKFDNNLVVVACASCRCAGGRSKEQALEEFCDWCVRSIHLGMSHTHTHTLWETDEGAKLFSRHLICLVWWTRYEYKLIINIRDCGIDPCYLQTIDSRRVHFGCHSDADALVWIKFFFCCSCDGFWQLHWYVMLCGWWLSGCVWNVVCITYEAFCYFGSHPIDFGCAHMID